MSSEQHTPVTHSSSNNFYIIWHKHVSTSTAELCYWYVINWHDLIYSRRHMRHVTSQTVSPKWALKSQALGGRKLGPQPQSSIVCGLCLVDLAPLYMTWPLFVEEENMTKMHSHTYMGISQHTYKIQFGSMQEKLQQHLFPSPIIDCPWPWTDCGKVTQHTKWPTWTELNP